MKILKWLVLTAVVGFCGLLTYDTFRGGYFSLPPLEDNQYPISFKSGLRAIVTIEDLREDTVTLPKTLRRLTAIFPEKRFFGYAVEVEYWIADAWAYCEPPSEQEVIDLRAALPEEIQRNVYRATLSWLCFVDVNGEQVFRGPIFTAPRL